MKKMPARITSVEQLFGTLPVDVDLDGKRGGGHLLSFQLRICKALDCELSDICDIVREENRIGHEVWINETV